MSQVEDAADVLDRAEQLAEKLEVIEKSGPYVTAMQAVGRFQKTISEMIDRTLSMMQAVHKVELQNTNFYVDILKFLIPIFATAAIAGATLDAQGINSLLLVIIGLVGIAGGALTLAPLLVKRHKKTQEQSRQYAKLAKALENWQKVAKLREQMSMDENFNSKKTKKLLEEIMSFANLVDGNKE